MGFYLADLAYSYLPGYVRAADDGTVYALLGAVCAPVNALVDLLRDTAAAADPMAAPAARLPWPPWPRRRAPWLT